jgi:hypothetical protein
MPDGYCCDGDAKPDERLTDVLPEHQFVLTLRSTDHSVRTRRLVVGVVLLLLDQPCCVPGAVAG